MVVLRFSREADMTLVAARAAHGLCAPSAATAFFEYESTNGIPDIVFARFDPNAVAARSEGALAGAFCERAEVAVLLALHESEAQTIADIAQRAQLSTSTVGARLRKLAAQDVVCHAGRGWRRLAPFACRLADATAVELKLADWRKALDQAARYRAFAERALVVVDEQRANAARVHADVFAFNGIGLAALSPWGEVEEIVPVAARLAVDPVARWVAGERLWADAGGLPAALAA